MKRTVIIGTILTLLISSLTIAFSLPTVETHFKTIETVQITGDAQGDGEPALIQNTAGRFLAYFDSHDSSIGAFNIRMSYSEDGYVWSDLIK